MKFPGEEEALREAKDLAEQWGYGNLIHYLQREWANKLIDQGLSTNSAAEASFMNATHVAEFVAECTKRAKG